MGKTECCSMVAARCRGGDQLWKTRLLLNLTSGCQFKTLRNRKSRSKLKKAKTWKLLKKLICKMLSSFLECMMVMGDMKLRIMSETTFQKFCKRTSTLRRTDSSQHWKMHIIRQIQICGLTRAKLEFCHTEKATLRKRKDGRGLWKKKITLELQNAWGVQRAA